MADLKKIAEEISKSLAKESIAIKINSGIFDLKTRIEKDAKIQIIAKSSLFWGYSISKTIQPEEAEFWQPVQYAQERAAVQLENDLMEAMRKGRQGTQAVHDFIPKVGIFLSSTCGNSKKAQICCDI